MRAFFRGKGSKTAQAESPTPNSLKKKRTPSRGQKENVDPLPGSHFSENCPPKGALFQGKASPAPASRSPLPPRPPPNPNETPSKKKKLNFENTAGNGTSGGSAMDSGVQIIVRMRPLKRENEGNQIAQKIAPGCISIMDHTFTFDSVADTGSTQDDIFQLVGISLVENCLAGFNSSIFAYGQTGSGKTHTMWGPSGALSEKGSLTSERGLMPRVFERLFLRINQEEQKHTDTQLNFQCHCSFLEIYNEQIMDLLNPSQKNLQIREDVRTGVYVDCLTEEYVSNIKDVIQVLLKGLANRRISATSMNAESSRSHCVFTCVVESRSKSVADGINSLKISRINLVDLAGSERQKLTCAVGDRLKEAGNINRSLSQLGNVINILAEVSQSGKQRHIPYRDSKLTFLLQESLGGNAKLAMICAISPSQSCKSETLSTLRFAQRAKAIKNKAVVNEIKQDDVNVLRDQIRQLKEELLRMKSGVPRESNGLYSSGWNARKSLSLLKMSLSRPVKLPVIDDDDDDDEEMEIDEDDVEQGHVLSDRQFIGSDLVVEGSSENGLEREEISAKNGRGSSKENTLRGGDDLEREETSAKQGLDSLPAFDSSVDLHNPNFETLKTAHTDIKEGTHLSPALKCRKSSTSLSLREFTHLEASLYNGLQILDNHSQKSSVRFSFRPVDSKPMTPVVVTNEVGVQTVASEFEVEDSELAVKCTNCRSEKSKQQLPKAVEKVLAGAIRREMALEEHCSRQNSEICQLKRLIQQYKHERGCNASIGQLREERIMRLENLMDGFLPAEEFMEEEFASLLNEHKLLKEKYDNHPEVLRVKSELATVQEELEKYRNFFDLGEREVLVDEIQDLKTQLQYYVDNSSRRRERNPSEERELQQELNASHAQIKKLNLELESERRCLEELKEALHAAMEGHTRILDQYADLQEKHMGLLARHQEMREGIEEVKRAAVNVGVNGVESKWVNSLAAQLSVLKVDWEKERKYWKEENKGLRSQMKDMAEAVEAAGELLVRLKEAEEVSATALERTEKAEREAEESRLEVDKLKKDHEREMESLKKALVGEKGDSLRSAQDHGHKWKEEFEQFYDPEEFSKGAEEASWFSRYDQCNM